MTVTASIRKRVKAGRKGGALWVRAVDVLRLVPTAEGRARLWTRFAHAGEVHQTSPDTAEERYPELFDLAARLRPDAARILSFGCSTGEELVALRRRFSEAEIVGAEINPRSRRIARRRVQLDRRISLVPPQAIDGTFDAIFALAVLQREPHKIAEMQVEDLSGFYPFSRFDGAITALVRRLRPGGLLCVDNAQYRVEDSSVASQLKPVAGAPLTSGGIFGPDGLGLNAQLATTMFEKR
jgi:SAM-dependent methyltransferase